MNPAAIFSMLRPVIGTIMLYSQQIAMGFVVLFGAFGTFHIFRREYGAAIRCAVFVFLIVSLFFGGLSFSFLQKTGGLFPSKKTEQTAATTVPFSDASSSIRPIEGSSGVYAGKGGFTSGDGGVYAGGGSMGGSETLSSGLMKMLNKF